MASSVRLPRSPDGTPAARKSESYSPPTPTPRIRRPRRLDRDRRAAWRRPRVDREEERGRPCRRAALSARSDREPHDGFGRWISRGDVAAHPQRRRRPPRVFVRHRVSRPRRPQRPRPYITYDRRRGRPSGPDLRPLRVRRLDDEPPLLEQRQDHVAERACVLTACVARARASPTPTRRAIASSERRSCARAPGTRSKKLPGTSLPSAPATVCAGARLRLVDDEAVEPHRERPDLFGLSQPALPARQSRAAGRRRLRVVLAPSPSRPAKP